MDGLSRRQQLAKNAAYLRSNMTYCEKRLWFGFLATYELSFRPQKVIGNYIVDFFCKKVLLSIEVDGDTHFEPKAIEYDKTRTSFLETKEIKELRFTNTDIIESFESVCEVIDQEVRKRRNDLDQSNFTDLISR